MPISLNIIKFCLFFSQLMLGCGTAVQQEIFARHRILVECFLLNIKRLPLE